MINCVSGVITSASVSQSCYCENILASRTFSSVDSYAVPDNCRKETNYCVSSSLNNSNRRGQAIINLKRTLTGYPFANSCSYFILLSDI